MTIVDEQGRPEPPVAAGEAATLLGFLDYHRATLAWKCSDVDEDGMKVSVGASAMTLGGMQKHLSYVEDWWFSVRLHGNEAQPPWDTVDWKADRDWDWNSAAADTPAELHQMWQKSIARSRELTAQAMAEGGLDRMAVRPWQDGTAPNLRWILVHMIEEYARHNGHADLIRESIDGLTGE
ncbi:DinB family protein [Nonomuraea typhae]|uniref:DinB family protein n=1 Tax=Nonomuraea typhae TaxID=2603600 RepID=UPI0012F8993B|nr:DinB family protein [Nonomuraea typhae]